MSNQQLRILRTTYCLAIIAAVLLAIIFETGLLLIGTRAYDSQTNYICEMIGVVNTVLGIWLALKFMAFGKVKEALKEQPSKYFRFSALRIKILTIPLIYDTAAYYLLGEDATLGYLALMTAVGFLFIWPSMGKMEYELGKGNESEK